VPPRGGTGKTLRPQRPAGRGRGWRLAHGSALEALSELGRRLTVMRGVLETLRVGGSWARELRRRSPGRGVQPRWLGARWRAWNGAQAPRVRRRETPNPEPWWRELWRARTPGEHRRAVPAWPGIGIVAERTPGGSKASKRAHRSLTGEPSASGKRSTRAAHFGASRRSGSAVARNVRHGSCVPGPPSGGFERQRAGADRESDRETPAGAAPAAIGK